MRIGIHCSVRKGFTSALEEAKSLGCETLQIFTQSPRGWKTRVYSDAEFKEFRQLKTAYQLEPLIVHSPYLPNLCTVDPHLYKKSVNWLLADLDRCQQLGADYLVVHPGSFSPESSEDAGIRQFVNALNQGLSAVSSTTMILIENMAGGGRRLGADFKDIATILASVKLQDRVGVCFDTCHATGAGYDLSSPTAVENTLREFDHLVGLNRIHVFHVNDSKGPVGDHRDRHEHIGKGFVGLAGFRALLNRPEFFHCALILETPKDPAPKADLKNLKVLRSLLKKRT